MLGAEEHNLILVLVTSFLALECGKSSKLGEKRESFEERLELFGSEWDWPLEDRFCTGPGGKKKKKNRWKL